MPPTMAAAMIQGLVPSERTAGKAVLGSVVDDGTGVVVVVVVGAAADEAAKATTWFAEGASNKSAPNEGVGKWLAGVPIVALSSTAPDDELSPYSTPFEPMVHTRPAATTGGPPPTEALHRRCSPAGEAETWTAIGPLRQGR